MSGILDQLSGGGERWKAWNVDQEPDPENNAEQSEDGIGPSPGDVGSMRSDMVLDPSSNDGDDTGWTVEDAIADRDATEVVPPVVDQRPSDPAETIIQHSRPAFLPIARHAGRRRPAGRRDPVGRAPFGGSTG